jgi:hypothetical protein
MKRKLVERKSCENLAAYRARFSYDNMATNSLQQKKVLNAFLSQIKLGKRSTYRLFAAAVGVPANYVWNNAKIYWRGLVECWEALEVDTTLDLSGLGSDDG